MQRAIERRRWSLIAAALAIALLAVSPTAAQTKIGMEGFCRARYSGGALEVRPFQENSPITLSIGEVTPIATSKGSIYELHFIATRPGQYDLRDYLVRVDGQPLTDMVPLPVSVVGLLPKDYDGDLESLGALKLPTPWPYRAVMFAVVLLWSFPAVLFLMRRLTRRHRATAIRTTKPPTLADQLRPLVAAAIAGTLSPDEKARLESLLIAFWRDSLQLGGLPTQEALARMRRHPQAGKLLRQLELWLYERPGRATVDVAAILAPYKNAAALSTATPGFAPVDLSAEAAVS